MERAQILIVEDELIVAKEIESDLRGFGYSVAGIARSADTAFIAIASSHPDLILMDIKLNGQIDGIQTAEQVMLRYDIPVIFISAFSDETTLQRAKETAPFGYLLKPFEPKELHTTIEMALYKHGMEKKLRQNERRLRLITDSMLDMVSQTDDAGRFVYVSPSHKHVLGYDSAELLETTYLEYVHPDDLAFVRLKIEEARAHCTRNTFELRFRHRNGQYLWLEADCNCVRSTGGEMIGTVFGARNITARHEAEARMRSSQAQLASVIGSAMDAIITIDGDHRIVLFNDAAETMFACRADEAIGQPLSKFIPAPLREAHDRYIDTFAGLTDDFRRFTGMMNTAQGVRTNGEAFSFEASISKTQSDGKPYFTVIMRDITERNRAEDALRRSEERYRLLVTQLPAQVWTTDLALRFTSTQGVGFGAIGVGPHQLDGLAIQEFFNTNDPAYPPMAAHRQALLGESVNYEMTIADHTFEAHVEPLRDSQGVVIGTLGVALDFTERKQAEEELHRERNLLRTIIEAIPDEVYVKDRQGRIILANQTSIRMCGVSSIDELLGKTDPDIFGTPEADLALANEQRLVATGIPMLNVEKERYHPQTGMLERSILVSKYPLHDAQGAIVGLVGINRDITDRRRSIEQMRRANLVIENTETIIFIWRPLHDLPVEYVSNNITIFGYTQSELMNGAISFLSVIHPDDLPVVLDTIADSTRRGVQRLHTDFRILCKNGETRWVNNRMKIVRDADGVVTNYEGIMQDITERKRAEHSLQLTQFSVDHASDAVFWISNTGAFMYVNRAACRQFGYTRDELAALTISDIDPRSSIERLWERLHECERRGESSFTADLMAVTKSGGEIPVEVTINRMEFGDTEYFFVSARNIKVRKEAEAALRTSMSNALKFSTLAAHELRTPLAIIRNQLENSLTPGMTPKKLRETIAAVYDEMLSLTNIVGDLLNLSKMQAGTFELKLARTPLHTVIQEFYDEALFLTRPKDITIVLKKCPKAFIAADVPRLRQVLFNLLDNALKHTPTHRQIRFGYAVEDSLVRLYFEDTGEGIPAEKVAKIFDAYYRAGDDLYKTDGIGLGLTLVKWIVELHRGTISVESVSGKGTSFFITLPLDTSLPADQS